MHTKKTREQQPEGDHRLALEDNELAPAANYPLAAPPPKMVCRMDWPAIASILGERGDRPLAVLDRSGRVRMFNRAMEQVLGWTRFQVEGQAWCRICVPPERESEAKRWITEALRGALRSYEATAQTKSGSRVNFRFEFSLVGRGQSQGLLMTATRSLPVQAFQGFVPGRDIDYEVSVVGTDFGSVARLCTNGEFVPITDDQIRCHSLLYGLSEPCADCPILRMSAAPWPRTLIRHRIEQAAECRTSTFEITTAEAIDPTLVRLRVRNIPETTLGAIQEAKVQRLAEQADLSRREREVLSYLLLGRGIEDMAKLIGISSRTVKHHQASVLQKLGADSRADLMRLVF